ncbi:MAG: DUF2203 domain-containing protein [Planctomycetes bacterium]|nr:DUF2203 domain-containing protein [Planctomycetota bacterium]
MMEPEQITTVERLTDRRAEVLFTPASANRALVLVGRIVADIVGRYADLMALRAESAELTVMRGVGERVAQLSTRGEQIIADLGQLQYELNEVGCELKDWEKGRVDFPASYQGRRVCLCWRLGEESVTHWHELDAGFAGRRPLDPDFG